MKKILPFLLLSFLFVILFLPKNVLAVEQIDDFSSLISINKDASIEVTEKISYDFSLSEKHGIFRDIPVSYQTNLGQREIKISNISIKNEKGEDYPFTSERLGRNLRLKIGDPDLLISGKKTYVISYKVSGAINYFDDHDELYWNVVGNDWIVPISKAGAIISAPASSETDDVKATCYIGPLDSKTPCLSSISKTAETATAIFRLPPLSSLASTDYFTIVVSLPKGLIVEPTTNEKLWLFLKNNYVMALPIFILIGMLFLWMKFGKDPLGDITIVPQFEAPKGLMPAEVGTIIDEKADNLDVTAEIIYLAVNGYLKITRVELPGLISKKTDYILNKLRGSDEMLKGYQTAILNNLFEKDKIEIKLSDLKDNFYNKVEKAKKEIYKSLISKGYFYSNPNSIRISYAMIALFLFFLGFVLAQFGLVYIISFAFSGAIVFIFSFFMPSRGKFGVLAKEHILGLKMYLTVAEKDRIEYHNAPEKNPELFDKLLPYAMVLKVEKQWARQFEGIYNNQPTWYNSVSAYSAFNSANFVNEINSFKSQANSTISSTASSGSSGFSGGSGGGFGGGGGGSW